MVEIKRYEASMADIWDAFVGSSRNGTFLFRRAYMDYHADRFRDHSLLFLQKGKLIGLLPANEAGSILYSHQGLTYGSLILSTKATMTDVLEMFGALMEYAKANGYCKIIYKPVPTDYHRYPSQEDLYALFRTGKATLKARNIASVVDLTQPIPWNRDRRYGANKAETDGLYANETDDLASFWKILEDNLHNKYGARPVHSLEEMQLLKSRFPKEIHLFMAYGRDGSPLAGTMIYLMNHVAHAQYISASPEGKHLHAVDVLFRHVMRQYSTSHRFFDFGTSNEDGGKVLNESLIYQKEGFGGRGIIYDTWELTL